MASKYCNYIQHRRLRPRLQATATLSDSGLEQDIKKLVAFVVPYAFLCSLLNCFYYWHLVDINPFDFIAFQGLLTYSAPFFVTAGFSLIPVWLLESWFPRKDPLPECKPERQRAFRLISFIGLVILLLSAALASTRFGFTHPDIYFGILAALVCVASALSPGLVGTLFVSRQAAVAASLVALCFPVVVLSQATRQAAGVLDATDYLFIQASNLRDLGGYQSTQQLVYYGKLSDFLFFRVNASLVAFPIAAFKQLEFKRYQKIKR